jgi:hypothetical protein
MMPLRNTPANMSGTLFLLSTLTFFIIFIMFSGCVQEDMENKGEDAAKDMVKAPPVEPVEKPKGIVKERSWRWRVEEGFRIKDGSVPYAMRLDDGGVRLYYCSAGGILSAISEDGLEFKKEPGARISVAQGGESIICDPTVVRMDDGMRMYYKGADGPGGPGEAVHRIYSAISRHGLSWKKEGVRIDSLKTSDRGWASVPEAVKLPDGSVRLYYVSNEGPHGIATAISKDGLSFERESGIILPGLVDPSVLIKNGSYFMFATSIEPRYLPQGIYMLTSQDGRDFELDKKVIIEASQERGVFDPAALLLKDGSIRLYYGEYSPQGMVIKSAIGRIE